MNKLVYLFELDSVRNGNKEIRTFNEEEHTQMIKNGEIVDGFTIAAYELYRLMKDKV